MSKDVIVRASFAQHAPLIQGLWLWDGGSSVAAMRGGGICLMQAAGTESDWT